VHGQNHRQDDNSNTTTLARQLVTNGSLVHVTGRDVTTWPEYPVKHSTKMETKTLQNNLSADITRKRRQVG